MKVYSVTTDGQARLVLADTFAEAIEADWRAYQNENEEDTRKDHQTLLEQVVLIGELG